MQRAVSKVAAKRDLADRQVLAAKQQAARPAVVALALAVRRPAVPALAAPRQAACRGTAARVQAVLRRAERPAVPVDPAQTVDPAVQQAAARLALGELQAQRGPVVPSSRAE